MIGVMGCECSSLLVKTKVKAYAIDPGREASSERVGLMLMLHVYSAF